MKNYNAKMVLQNILDAIKQCDSAIEYIKASSDKDKYKRITDWNRQKALLQNLLK